MIKSGELKKRSIVENGKYNDYLKYSGDQKLLIHIHTLESEIHKQRKELSKERYSKKLHKLVILRNEYAKTAGYGNYLDYKYAEYGVEKELLKQKILKEKNQIHTYHSFAEDRKYFKEISSKDIFQSSNQIHLLKEVIDNIGIYIDWSNIIIYTEQLPDFYRAVTVPIAIPDECSIFINTVSGMGGFSVLLHELGHACYYTSISHDLSNEDRRPLNSIVEEGIALWFENLIFTSEVLNELLGLDKDLIDFKMSLSLFQQIGFVEFEQLIYKNETIHYDDVWKEISSKYGINHSWMNLHFFVSEPGYFAAYLLGGYFARDTLAYMRKDNIFKETNKINKLLGEICNMGRKFNLNNFLDKIDF